MTVVTTRRVKPGREADFEVWLEGIGAEAARFPGLVGRRITRPADHDHPEYVIVFKFDSYPHLRAWTESPARRRWLDEVRALCEDEFKETVLSGLETWFTLPARPGLPPPPRYKMAVVSLLVIFPLGQGLGSLLGPLLGDLPVLARSFAISIVMILTTTYVVMPRVTRLLKGWLYPGA